MKLKFFSILSGGDTAYLPFYDNFLFHLERVGLKKDHELIKVDTDTGLWQSENFLKVTMTKLDYTRKFLKEGFTVLLSDLDIVFLKNPIPYLSSRLKEKDIVFQFAGKRNPANYNPSLPNKSVNTGFYIVKPTALNIDLFDTRERVDFVGHDHSDQGYIHSKLCLMPKYKELCQGILPPPLFPNGYYWFNNYEELDPYIVHYNYLFKHEDKINKMKKHNHWKVPTKENESKGKSNLGTDLGKLKNDTQRKILTITDKYDGFGSQYSGIISGLVYCRYYNYIYRHTPFKRVAHQPELTDELNKFTGFKSDQDDDFGKEVDIIEKRIFEPLQQGPNCFFTKEVLGEIRSMYYSTPKPHKCKYDIAIHIRLGDLLKPDHEYKRESAKAHAKNRIISLGRYKKLISLIKQKNPKFTICIYSQGSLEDFKELQQENVYFSLDTDLMTTFHELVTAPRLVVAPSSLSRVAGIISEGKVLVFPHKFNINPPCLGWKSIHDEYGEDV